MGQQELETFTKGMYQRVNSKWNQHRLDLATGECGFSVLSGPPIYQPDLMIIGENPGYGAGDHGPHIEDTWPVKSHIEDAEWPLAVRLRNIFENAGLTSVLRNSIQTNFLFFKSTSLGSGTRYVWNDNPHALRSELVAFCQNELKQFIRLSQP